MKNGQSPIAIAIIVVVILIAGFFVFSFSKSFITGNVIVEEETCKKVETPYEVLEEYTEQEPYSEQVCNGVDFKYKVDEGTCYPYQYLGTNEPARYSCKIKNLEPYDSGFFTIKIGFLVNGKEQVKTESFFVSQNGYSKTFNTETSNPIESCICYVEETPKKPGCETITNYKTVTKTRTATKYKTETVCE